MAKAAQRFAAGIKSEKRSTSVTVNRICAGDERKWINPAQECLPPDYDRCMLSLYYKGQNNAYTELDLKRGTIVKDGVRIAPGRNFVSWIDRNTLVVAHTTQKARRRCEISSPPSCMCGGAERRSRRRHHIVEAFSPDRPDCPFHIAVLLG